MSERTGQEDEALRVNSGEENLRRASKHPALGAPYSGLAPAIYGVDPVVNAVCLKLQQRSALGLAKYKTTLADSQQTRLEFLVHAQDEALDLANYLQVLIDKELTQG